MSADPDEYGPDERLEARVQALRVAKILEARGWFNAREFALSCDTYGLVEVLATLLEGGSK